jgi:hypothetical protein
MLFVLLSQKVPPVFLERYKKVDIYRIAGRCRWHPGAVKRTEAELLNSLDFESSSCTIIYRDSRIAGK